MDEWMNEGMESLVKVDHLMKTFNEYKWKNQAFLKYCIH
jgi:hypothetical protein